MVDEYSDDYMERPALREFFLNKQSSDEETHEDRLVALQKLMNIVISKRMVGLHATLEINDYLKTLLEEVPSAVLEIMTSEIDQKLLNGFVLMAEMKEVLAGDEMTSKILDLIV